MLKSAMSTILVTCLLFATVIISAQDTDEPSRTIVYGRPYNTNTDNTSLSNYFCGNLNCNYVVGAMYIVLIGVDAETGWYAPNLRDGLAKDWEFSEDGRVFTLYLRDDMQWSDGTPITAVDVMMSHELRTASELNPSGDLVSLGIENVEVVDDYAIQFTLTERNCNAIDTINYTFPPVPAHIYRGLIEESGYADLVNNEWFNQPNVVSGFYQYESTDENATYTMSRNQNFVELDGSEPTIDGFKQFSILDIQEVTPEWFLESEVNVLEEVEPEHKSAFIAAASAGELQVYQYPDDLIRFLAMNQADPTNPQPAFDENGNQIEQGIHPIFGDVKVRQAMAYAIDIDSLIETVENGLGRRLTSHIISSSWAYNYEIEPIPYNQEQALALLAEAGWRAENPDLPASSENRLICENCLYATEVDEQFNGSYLEFDLVGGNPVARELLQSQLAEIGIVVNLSDENFFEQLLGQTFDAALVGFAGSYPYNPVSDLFTPQGDLPFAGFNATSFYNEAYFALEETALTVPNCGLTERARIYQQMQRILQDDMPFVWLYSPTEMFVAKNEVIGFDPRPDNWWWNYHTWQIDGNE